MRIAQETFDKLSKLVVSAYDENGHEVPNPAPMEIPIGMDRPPTLKEQVQRIMRSEISMQAQGQGSETFEEANDFEIEDEFDIEPISKYVDLAPEWPMVPDTEPETEAPEPIKVEEPAAEGTAKAVEE